MNTLLIVLTVIVILVVGGILALIFHSRQRSRNLQDEFGPEYDRTVEDVGNRRKAEDNLENRRERAASIQSRKLDPDEQERFLKKWEMIQYGFIEEPVYELDEAGRLITEVMLARGYPMAQFDQQAEDLSVNYPEVVDKFRGAHSTAVRNRKSKVSTEELRKAMLDYKTVFYEVLDLETEEEPEPEKAVLSG